MFQRLARVSNLSRYDSHRVVLQTNQWRKGVLRSFSTGSDDALVKLDHDENSKVSTITLNNPSLLNAMSVDMGNEFVQVVETLSKNVKSKDIRCVIITGEGKGFSAGGDFGFLRDRHVDTPENNYDVMRAFYKRMLSLRQIPVPTIAAINGPAIGAGLAVALACDLRVVAKNAPMGITFVNLGLHPGMGSTFFLSSLVGPQLAARMCLTGEVIKGTEAVSLGLALSAHEDGPACLESAQKLAKQIAQAAPIAVRTTLKSLRSLQEQERGGLDRALMREADAQAQCFNTDDYIEGINALEEKRRPSFKNK